jgi:hypothetical protein
MKKGEKIALGEMVIVGLEYGKMQQSFICDRDSGLYGGKRFFGGVRSKTESGAQQYREKLITEGVPADNLEVVTVTYELIERGK